MTNHSSNVSTRLMAALVITLIFVAAEAAAGLYANSLALLADAAHNLTDALALGLSLYAVYLARRPATASKTYGYHRAGILAALANASTLVLVALFILYEAYQRLMAPPEVEEQVIAVVAGVAGVINIFIAIALHHDSRHDLNIRSAFIHMAGDAVATIAVALGGLVIHFTGLQVVDPLLSVLIGVAIAWTSWGILREGIHILLEGSPRGLDMQALVRDMRSVSGVQGVHDLHAWSITVNMHALSAHVMTEDVSLSEGANIQRQINALLNDRYNITHTALQLECVGCCPDTLYCEWGGNGGGEHS